MIDSTPERAVSGMARSVRAFRLSSTNSDIQLPLDDGCCADPGRIRNVAAIASVTIAFDPICLRIETSCPRLESVVRLWSLRETDTLNEIPMGSPRGIDRWGTV